MSSVRAGPVFSMCSCHLLQCAGGATESREGQLAGSAGRSSQSACRGGAGTGAGVSLQACRAALSVSKIHTPLSERGRVIGSGQVNHSDMRCRPSPSAEVGEFAAVGPVIGGGEVRELRAFTL